MNNLQKKNYQQPKHNTLAALINKKKKQMKKRKSKYAQPKLYTVLLDKQISLQLDSTPPELDNENVHIPVFKTNNMA